MGRPRFNPKAKMAKVSVTIDPDLMTWAKDHCGPSLEFASLSHAVNVGLRLLSSGKRGH